MVIKKCRSESEIQSEKFSICLHLRSWSINQTMTRCRTNRASETRPLTERPVPSCLFLAQFLDGASTLDKYHYNGHSRETYAESTTRMLIRRSPKYISLIKSLRFPPTRVPSLRTMSTKKSESEWQAILSPEQFRVLREKGTEPPGTGKYDKHKADGIYSCAGCGTPLYKSTTKFNSGCGWPAFFDAIPGAVSRHEDHSMFTTRTEITCTACGGHLGHVFKGEGFGTPTDERHCVNSVSLNFAKEDSN
jgi:peptide-methionine (R)-S-oxide reductase